VYAVIYKKSAQKSLQRMPRKIASKFIEAFEQLAKDPVQTDLDIKPLIRRQGFRLRIAGWKAIYRVEQGRLIIYVLTIGTRGGVYK
jgi:mRNA interferase RelE/StbE